MKARFLASLAVGALLAGGCQTPQKTLPAATKTASQTTGVGYDDRRVAMIRRDETTESQLLDWFGPPES
jgi:hypothetical protein